MRTIDSPLRLGKLQQEKHENINNGSQDERETKEDMQMR